MPDRCAGRIAPGQRRERSGEEHGECYSREDEWILRRGLIDNRGKHPAGGDTEQHPNDRPAGQQDQQTAERRRQNLLCLRTEGDADAEFTEPLAHGI